MNKKQIFLLSFAALAVVYIIVLLLTPGWGASKILSIIACACTLIAIYGTYRAEKKK
ncbi:MAG: hypothetical protein II404_05880 [Prevotella sp.]|nr:hypothetical protein [Prevotella sp.]